MRKVQFFASIWTIILAIPFVVVALISTAYLTEHMTQIIRIIADFSQRISVSGRGLVLEFSARWPEVAGMIIGMIVILTIYLFAQNANNEKDIQKFN